MERKRLIIYLGLLLSFVSFTGCSSESEDLEDGKWPAIQFTVNGQQCASELDYYASYNVSAEGGEFKIYSSNYGSLWLNAIYENEDIAWPENYEWSDYKNINLTNSWYQVQYDKSGNIVVNIQPKEKSSTARNLTFCVECGDVFGEIALLQE